MESQILLEEGDIFWRDLECFRIDILSDVYVWDIEITSYRAAYQGHNGQVEETIIHGDFASLDDAKVGTTDSQRDGDA